MRTAGNEQSERAAAWLLLCLLLAKHSLCLPSMASCSCSREPAVSRTASAARRSVSLDRAHGTCVRCCWPGHCLLLSACSYQLWPLPGHQGLHIKHHGCGWLRGLEASCVGPTLMMSVPRPHWSDHNKFNKQDSATTEEPKEKQGKSKKRDKQKRYICGGFTHAHLTGRFSPQRPCPLLTLSYPAVQLRRLRDAGVLALNPMTWARRAQPHWTLLPSECL